MINSAVCRITLAALLVLSAGISTVETQAIDAGAIFRVFLKTGQALPTYGESAIVGNRVVFTLLVGSAEARAAMQLMSLPAERVDLVRTRRYADAMRARHYAATRGEVDYAAMTQEVQRTLAQLTSVADPKKRLELAQEARSRLLAWATGTYGYRAAEVRELTGLFDEVITELGAAAGQRQFAVDLQSGPADSPPETLLSAPTLSESIALALDAARVADGESDRLAILRAAEGLAGASGVPAELSATLRRELEAESTAAVSYANLFSFVRARADEARRRTDVAGVEAAISALRTGDRQLGSRRPQSVDALLVELAAVLDATRTHRAALDRYATIRGSLLQYERTVRPVMSGLDGLTPVFTALREMHYMAYDRLVQTTGRIAAFRTSLDAIAPPADLADVHATLDSALKMATYAVARRRLAMSIISEVIDKEASSAAAGVLSHALGPRARTAHRAPVSAEDQVTTRRGAMQRRTLIRARDLTAFREAVIHRALAGAPIDARRRAVVVPTRAAAELLRQSMEARLDGDLPAGAILPDFVTRLEFVERLGAAIPGAHPILSTAERLVLLERAARLTAARPRMSGAPFPLRPGLVAAMLDFYDELHRRQRPVRRFAEALFEQLRGERGTDRGSESLIHQTCFLGYTFLAYERSVADSNSLDEHGLRRALLEQQPVLPFDHAVIAVADHPSDPRGLWPADFDLVGRLRGLKTLDVVVTDALHDAGFRERMESELPGIRRRNRFAAATSRPVILQTIPRMDSRNPFPESSGHDEEMCVVSRDREDELREVARAVRRRAGATGGALEEATAVVFHRPLPYLYLAQRVFADAHVPYQAFDALPLAAQPYAALLDVVLTAARTGMTREPAVEVIRSGLLVLSVDGVPVSGRDVAALDEVLAARRSVGEADTFAAEIRADRSSGERRRNMSAADASRAAQAAVEVRRSLSGFRDGPSASAQVRAILDFLRKHERVPEPADPWRERHLRARAAVQAVLEGLARAFELHDDAPRPHEDISAAIRYAIEAETFTPDRMRGGVHLVDAVAARFGAFDHVHVVGLVETDWPERPRRNIFYTAGLLKSLGWPQEPDQARVQQAMFQDLLALPARTLTLHAFQFEGDALLARSPLVEIARDRARAPLPVADHRRIFDDEVLTGDAIAADALPATTASWLALRETRPALALDDYGGFVGPQEPRRYRVSRVDHYVLCPFKYFAENVLGLPEERDDMAGLTPLERGNLVHGLFERFYRTWDERREGTITAANLPEAVALFAQLTDEALARLPEADRVLERTRLLGSLVAPGVAERVFELEADKGGSVVRRLLESDLKGPFTFPLLGGLKTRIVEISGKADRIDVFADGSLRVIDYKLSRLPDIKSSIQIAVYAYAAQQWLQAQDGKSHPISAASYLAFGDEDRLEGSLGSRDQPASIAVETRAAEFAAVIERIEAGEFPPQPRQPGECQWCRYAGVCRKEYREAVDEAAESV